MNTTYDAMIISLLQQIFGASNSSGAALAGPIADDIAAIKDNTTGVQRTPTVLNTTAAGTIPAGTTHASIANIGSASGLVNGASFPAGAAIDFPTNYPDTNAAITYDASFPRCVFLVEYII